MMEQSMLLGSLGSSVSEAALKQSRTVTDDLTVGCYLGARLRSIGVTHFFTVSGDFTLNLLAELSNVEGLSSVPCCNELNAGYAADGYARASGTLGVVVGELQALRWRVILLKFVIITVTYMVGALSLINAIAGGYAEGLPLLVIVGAPRSNEHRNVHHVIKDVDSSTCRNTFKEVTKGTFSVSRSSHAQGNQHRKGRLVHFDH
jgi:pyruvate decarboxylase